MISFIVNPLSGNGKGKRLVPLIKKRLKEKNIPFQFYMTEYRGHAITLAKTLRTEPQSNIVIAIGGDGTLNEVINGLFPSDVQFGYIPAGAGNDFAREMGIPKDPFQALERIIYGDKREIDVGQFNGRYFVNAAGIGFDGKVTQIANQSPLKKRFGKFVYIFAVIQALFGYRPTELEIIVDGKKHLFEKVWLTAVSNGRYFGGGMMISPNAKNNDGILDVCVISGLTAFQLIKFFPTIFSGRHIQLPYVTILRGSSIKVHSNEILPIQIDGEIPDSEQDEKSNILLFQVMEKKLEIH